MMLLVAVLTALISVNGAVAALLPVVVVMAVRLRPLAVAAAAAARVRRARRSLLALTGTPVNVIVSEAADDAGRRALRLLRVRARRRAARGRHDRDRRALRRAAAAEPERRGRCSTRLQRPRAHARRAVRARATIRTTLLTPRVRRRRGRDPAALGADRRHRRSRAWSPRAATSSILAVQRKGEELAGETVLAAGDTLLLQGAWARSTSTSTTRRCSSSTSRSSCAGRRCRSGRARERALVDARRRWSSCSRPAPCRRRSRACSPPARSSCSGVLTIEQAYRGDLVDDRDARRPG